MANNLVAVEAKALLDASNGTSSYTNPTTPIKLALVTSTGTATAAGTEVSGGSYARQTVTYTAGSTANPSTCSNSGAISYVNMPACTVTGVDEYDSAGTPIRRWFGGLTANKTVNAGDTFTFASGAVTKSLG